MVRSKAMTLLLMLGLLFGTAMTAAAPASAAKPAAKAKAGLAKKTVLTVSGMT